MSDLLLTIEARAEVAMSRLREFESRALKMNPAGYYVAFSGGKDSIVTLDLVRRAGVKHEVHFNVTSVDPPELLAFISKHYPGIHKHRPGKNNMFALIVKKMMPPTRVVRYCCEALKEHGGAGRMVVTGIRWAESARRAKRQITEVCFKDETRVFRHPIIDWKDGEIWEYIHDRKLPYPSLYDEGFKRIGCVGCPMAGDGRLTQFARWPHYERAYRRAFAAAAAANRAALGPEFGGRGRNAKLRWKDGDAMWRWWMDESAKGINDPDQEVMFE